MKYDRIEGIDKFHREYDEDDGIIFVTLSPIRETLPSTSKRPSLARKSDKQRQHVIKSIKVPGAAKAKKNPQVKSRRQSDKKS